MIYIYIMLFIIFIILFSYFLFLIIIINKREFHNLKEKDCFYCRNLHNAKKCPNSFECYSMSNKPHFKLNKSKLGR